MSKSTRNTGKSWSSTDIAALEKLAKGNTPTRVIGLKLGRTPDAIYAKASEEGISSNKPVSLRDEEKIVSRVRGVLREQRAGGTPFPPLKSARF